MQLGVAGDHLAKIYHDYVKDLSENRFDERARNVARKKVIEELISENLLSSPDVGNALRSSMELAERLQIEGARALAESGHDVIMVYFTLASPGLVGAGSGVFKSIFEVGLMVDRLLGLPYYPGSTVKGAARSACESLIKGDLASRVCGALYGSSGREGRVGAVIHGPMLPVGCSRDLGPCTVYWGDVVTPHYYEGGRVRGSELEASPNPVIHLSIAPGTVFAGYLAIPKGARSYAKRAVEELGRAGGNVVVEDLKQYASNPLLLAAVFAVSGVISGLGARSGKGYNEVEPSSSGAIPLEEFKPDSLIEGFERSVRRIRVLTGSGYGGRPRGRRG